MVYLKVEPQWDSCPQLTPLAIQSIPEPDLVLSPTLQGHLSLEENPTHLSLLAFLLARLDEEEFNLPGVLTVLAASHKEVVE